MNFRVNTTLLVSAKGLSLPVSVRNFTDIDCTDEVNIFLKSIRVKFFDD